MSDLDVSLGNAEESTVSVGESGTVSAGTNSTGEVSVSAEGEQNVSLALSGTADLSVSVSEGQMSQEYIIEYLEPLCVTTDEESIEEEEISGDPMTGATADEDGEAGIVPAPSAGDQGKALTGAGVWGAHALGEHTALYKHTELSEVISLTSAVWNDALTLSLEPGYLWLVGATAAGYPSASSSNSLTIAVTAGDTMICCQSGYNTETRRRCLSCTGIASTLDASEDTVLTLKAFPRTSYKLSPCYEISSDTIEEPVSLTAVRIASALEE